MTRILALLLLCAVSVGATAATAPATPPKTEDDKVVFAIGEILSGSVKPFALTEHEMQLVSAGFAAGMHGAKTSVDADAYRPKIQALLSARAERGLSAAKAAGKAYRDKAATAKDTTTTASGLMMTTLRAGSGASPAAEDEVKVHYVGKLIDGTEFDSSIKRGQPATFKLNGVIPCWTEALPHMKVGGKARLVCPAELAYGDRGSPPKIPGGSTLVFDVELLDVVKAEVPAAPAAPAAPSAPAAPAAPATSAAPAQPEAPAAPAAAEKPL
jgi:FKBP-type peptidyl-prolyl cis-trans isomerase FkpA